jgi:seryl-tRNA synthetase
MNDEQRQVAERALTIPEQARSIEITSNEDYTRAGELLLIIKDLRKQIDSTFDPIIKKQHEAHKEAVAQKKKVDAPLVEAEGIIKPRIASWNAEQERIRREEEARLREIARKEEEERRLAEALAAEEEAKRNGASREEAAAEVETILNEPVYVAPVIVPKSTPRVQGISTVTRWKFRVVNPTVVPREYLVVDEQKIGGVVRAMKDATNIPGIEVYSEDSISAGRRAFS